MKTCRNCGRVNSDTAQHCIQCGHLLPQQSDGMTMNNGMPMGGSTQPNFQTTNAPNVTNYAPVIKTSGLFRNAGAKLKILAIVVFVMEIIGGLIGGISIIATGADAYFGGGFLITAGIIMILVSPLFGWLSAIKLYAFGELCENVNDIRNQKR